MKRMFAAAKQPQTNDLLIYVYDEIGTSFWAEGITAKGIAAELSNAGKIDSITLRINSPGGDVFEGLAIFNLIRTQGVPVTVMVDGVAASAASIIAMAGDRIAMADNSLLMIHNAWTVAIGDARDLRKTADTLDTVSGALAETYVNRSGQSPEDVRAMMDAETWLTASTALEKGFATEIIETKKEDAAAAMALAASFNLSGRFASLPEALAAPPAGANPAPVNAAAVMPPQAEASPVSAQFELELLEMELTTIE